MTKSKYQLIDIFSGIGCASLGFSKAGFQLAAALEIDSHRCETYEKNLKLSPIKSDIMKVNGKDILFNAGLKKGDRFCVVGCPPCQSFSQLSDTRGIDARNDPRSKYVMKFAKLVEEMKPVAVVFENVPGMIEGQGKIFFERYCRLLEKAQYYTMVDIVNAADHGVPQNRRRVIAISIRKKFVNKKVIKEIENFYKKRKRKHKTVKQAIGRLKPLGIGQSDPKDPLHVSSMHSEKVLKIIRNIPKNGGSRKDLPRHLWLTCHKKLGNGAESVYGRMSWNKPSPTITCRCTTPACGRFIHPTQNRGVTLREAARLQTIPDNFKFVGYKEETERMIGDAVPYILAKKIAEKLLEVLP